MRRPTLVLLAVVSTAAAPPIHPSGQVVFRPECFGGFGQDVVITGGTSTVAAPTPPPPPPPPAPRPAPAPPPEEVIQDVAPRPPSSADATTRRRIDLTPRLPNLGGGGGKKKASAAAPEAEPPPVQTEESTIPFGAPKPSEAPDTFGAPQKAPAEDYEYKDTTKEEEAALGLDGRITTRPDHPSADRQQAQLDWGATVYLSNDDSMSLASAQRLLYAAVNRLSFTVRQIRPHELLNYFSFDSVAPDADQMFDVLASAEQDGDHLSVALAVKGAAPLPQPLDLTVVVDRSCSMADEGRMDFTRRGLQLMGDQLRKGDRLDVVLFDDKVCVPLENYVVGRDDPNLLAQTLRGLQPEGSTDVGLGLRTAYDVAKRHTDTHGRNRRILLVTDALMNTGDIDPNTVSEIGRAYDADHIRLTGVGVGRDFDDTVLDLLTEKGKGAYVFLGSAAVVDRVFGPTGFQQLVQTIAHDVHFALKLPPSLALERFYGEEASTDIAEVQPVHYYAGTTQLFLQDLVLRDGRPVPSDPVQLEITYRDATTGEPESRTFQTTVGAMIGADPHNVRKGLALMAWTDWLTAQAMGDDPCGEPLAAYASRAGALANDAEIAFVNGLVQQRCGGFQLPRVVSNKGVPFKVRVDTDIPISTVALACPGGRATESLSGSDFIAMFTMPPGVCELTLSGTVDMTAMVEVPSTGGDLRCMVRAGRVSCS